MIDRFTQRKQEYKYYLQILSKPCIYTFQNPRIQNFSLPFDVIVRILHQKRSPNFLLKLYQTCKYFFKKLSVLPLKYCLCSTEFVYSCTYAHNISKKVLFWFYHKLSLFPLSSTVLQRIYCCNLKEFFFTNYILPFADFQNIVSNSKILKFNCDRSTVIYPNGSTVPLNIILQHLPDCVELLYENKNEQFSRETLQSMNELIFSKLFNEITLTFYFVSNDFDPYLFWKFVKKNISPNSSLYITNNKEIDENVRAAFKHIFFDWNGAEPKIFFYTLKSIY